MTDEELIEELSEMGGHPCRAHLPMGERLRQAADRIEALTAENERLRDRLAALAQQAEALGGCGDANCVIHRPKGQHTNGGFHCYENRAKVYSGHWQWLVQVRATLEKQP